MIKLTSKTTFLIFFVFIATLSFGQVEFTKHIIVPEGTANTWWARSHADVNNDGLVDSFVIDNNAKGGGFIMVRNCTGF